MLQGCRLVTTTEEKLISLAKSHFKKEDKAITADADLFDALGINSYKAMELLSEVEDHFGIEVPDYELQDVRTFQQLAEIVNRRL